jgi:hypothetical protein
MAMEYTVQDLTKLTQIGIFWFENMPSGNPGHGPLMKPEFFEALNLS